MERDLLMTRNTIKALYFKMLSENKLLKSIISIYWDTIAICFTVMWFGDIILMKSYSLMSSFNNRC